MKTGGTNLLVLTISAFWSSSMWPLATWMSFRRQRSIPLGGRYRQVSLYLNSRTKFHVILLLALANYYQWIWYKKIRRYGLVSNDFLFQYGPWCWWWDIAAVKKPLDLLRPLSSKALFSLILNVHELITISCFAILSNNVCTKHDTVWEIYFRELVW